MALINCPHCGKQVSDTAPKCVHCGNALEKPVEKRTNFNSLSHTERQALKVEFWKLYPQYNLSETEENAYNTLTLFRTLSVIAETVGWVLVVLAELFDNDFIGNTSLILIIVGFIATFALSIAIRIKQKGNTRKKMLCEKKFWKWITKEKNMDYTVHFVSVKEEEIYNQINVDYDEL